MSISSLPGIFSVAPNATLEEKKAAFDRAAESFESVFISQLVKGMRETFCKDFMGGKMFGKDIYMSFIDDALSDALAGAGGIGVKDQLERWVFPTEKETSPSLAAPKEGKGLRFNGRF
jgi:Rod binding domain-containing protein